MASPAMAYGERRFAAALTARILVTLLVAGFLAGVWAVQNDSQSGAHPILMWISMLLVGALVAFWIVQGKSALIINDAGVRRESVFGQQEMAWSQIAHTNYRVVPINAYAHLGLIGALLAASSKSGRAQLTLELVSTAGKKLKVTSGFRDASEAIGIILARILPGMVQNAKARVQHGETVHFGGLGISAVAVTWKNLSIPLSEITKAEIAGSNLQIKKTGKWLAAISVRSDKVPDVLAFLELLEFLAPQVKASGIDPLARVRM
jgi:Family of unknown function (DUF6585)